MMANTRDGTMTERISGHTGILIIIISGFIKFIKKKQLSAELLSAYSEIIPNFNREVLMKLSTVFQLLKQYSK